MKRRYPEPVGQIIAHAIEQSGASDTFKRQRICFLWPEVVGPTINRVTTRRWVDRDELHIVIASGPIKNELSFMRSRLVELLNAAAGENIISTVVIH